ncbi:MAG: flagellar export chaperone FlgN [Phycisphaerae bacterium]|nr:flagellar export chaperone FlgN [Phycisphaerae bacterium]
MADLIDNIIDTMRDDLRYQRDLEKILTDKLDAIRNNDIALMEIIAQTEYRTVQAINNNIERTNKVIRQATAFYFPIRAGQLASATELKQFASESQSQALDAIGTMLRGTIENVKRQNQIVSLVTQKLLGHVDQIFKVIAHTGRDIGLYGRRGDKKINIEQNRMLDAIA